MMHAARRMLALAGLIAAYALLGAATAGAAPTGIVCTNGPTFNLEAGSGHVDTPDGNVVYMWSYTPTGGAFQTPGPVLCVNQGDTVTINLHNNLPVATSIVLPGQENVTATGAAGLLTNEAPASGGTATYTFTASQPGTYLYESGTNAQTQVDMGLYGAIVVRPTSHANYAYGDARTQFDPSREYLVLIAEIDPALHKAIETGVPTFDTLAFWPRYWTINGREFPDTLEENNVSWLPSQPYGSLVKIKPYDATANPYPAMIRMLNAGEQNHPFHPHGNHLRLIGQDGRLMRTADGANIASTEHFGDTIAAGQTLDLLLSWTDQDGFSVANPVPLQVPSYKNLTFKDATTWYSGSPYLGEKGTLPTGTTSYNICGELYFPWHSHALNEFVNYDIPFGGLATLLRVDPLIGCTTFPSSTKITTGALSGSGTFANLAADDAAVYSVATGVSTTVRTATTATATSLAVASSVGFPTASFTIQVDAEQMQVTAGFGTTTWTVTRHVNGTLAAIHNVGAPVRLVTATPTTDWYAGFTGVAAGATNLKVTYSGTNSVNCNQSLYLWKWAGASGSWVQVSGPTTVGTTAVNVALPAIADPSQYIGTGSVAGQLRLRVACTGTGYWVSSGNLAKLVYDAP